MRVYFQLRGTMDSLPSKHNSIVDFEHKTRRFLCQPSPKTLRAPAVTQLEPPTLTKAFCLVNFLSGIITNLFMILKTKGNKCQNIV